MYPDLSNNEKRLVGVVASVAQLSTKVAAQHLGTTVQGIGKLATQLHMREMVEYDAKAKTIKITSAGREEAERSSTSVEFDGEVLHVRLGKSARSDLLNVLSDKRARIDLVDIAEYYGGEGAGRTFLYLKEAILRALSKTIPHHETGRGKKRKAV